MEGAATVLVVGAGPVGLTMAAELARHGVRCRIVDRLRTPSPYCRALGVTPRTLEVWDDMGIARAAIDAGIWLEGTRTIIDRGPSVDTRLDLSDLPYGALGLPQYETERILAAHLTRFDVAVERGVTVTSVVQHADGVAVTLEHDGGTREETTVRWVVGCDGAHSTVRHAAGIGFTGDAFDATFMLGDVHVAWDLPRGMTCFALRPVADAPPELFVAIPLPEPGRYRVSTLAPPELAGTAGGSEHGLQTERPGPSLDQLQAVADALLPAPPVLTDLRWSSLFRISMRLADRYREGRLLLAGDAAHIHPPTGGQGMNTGIQDAYNLAWKLALVVRGVAPATLLDSYDPERRPVGAAVVAATRAASEGLGREHGPRDRLADTQMRVSYRGTAWVQDDAGDALPPAAPAAGDRAPDCGGLRRLGVGFPLRIADVLRGTELVVLAHVADGAPLAALAGALRAAFGERLARHVRIVGVVGPGHSADVPGVAVLSDVDGRFLATYGAGGAYLVRPDGYVGWRGTLAGAGGLVAHLARVLGGPSSST